MSMPTPRALGLLHLRNMHAHRASPTQTGQNYTAAQLETELNMRQDSARSWAVWLKSSGSYFSSRWKKTCSLLPFPLNWNVKGTAGLGWDYGKMMSRSCFLLSQLWNIETQMYQRDAYTHDNEIQVFPMWPFYQSDLNNDQTCQHHPHKKVHLQKKVTFKAYTEHFLHLTNLPLVIKGLC